MKINRRSFVSSGSLVACGMALNATSLVAAVPRALPLPLCANAAAVLVYVRSYSANFRVVAAPAPGSEGGLRKLHLLVEMADVSRWPATMAKARFAHIGASTRAQGNTLSFAFNGLDVTIENLTPAVFAARLG
jgi:hypothetical protein